MFGHAERGGRRSESDVHLSARSQKIDVSPGTRVDAAEVQIDIAAVADRLVRIQIGVAPRKERVQRGICLCEIIVVRASRRGVSAAGQDFVEKHFVDESLLLVRSELLEFGERRGGIELRSASHLLHVLNQRSVMSRAGCKILVYEGRIRRRNAADSGSHADVGAAPRQCRIEQVAIRGDAGRGAQVEVAARCDVEQARPADIHLP